MTATAFCTAVSRNYIGEARMLTRMLQQHHPGVPVYVLGVDPVEGLIEPADEPFEFVTLNELPHREHARQMTFYYNPFELCCAVRPMLHLYMLEHTQADRWLFIDTDVLVRGPLDRAFAQLDDKDILIDPHLNQPAADAYVHEEEFEVSSRGIFNGGFVGLRRGDVARRFAEWWHQRMRHYGHTDRCPGWDQLWLTFAPVFFEDHVKINRDAGLNLGHWDLHETTLIPTNDGDYLANGQTVKTVHFSGWSPHDPARVTKHVRCYDGQHFPAWEKWGLEYKAWIDQHQPGQTRGLGYGYATFTDGTPIREDMRWLYLDWLERGKDIGNPFDQPELFKRESRKVWFARRKKELMFNLRRAKERFW